MEVAMRHATALPQRIHQKIALKCLLDNMLSYVEVSALGSCVRWLLELPAA
jgi:hypothetical protein